MKTVEEFFTLPPFDYFGAIEGRAKPHRGADWSWAGIFGEQIPSPFNGTVVYNGRYGGELGYVVIIECDGFWVGFCHLIEPGPIPVGGAVAYGQWVASVGNTGTASTGPHLHLALSVEGWDIGAVGVIDPVPWLISAMASMQKTRPKEDMMIRLVFKGFKPNGKDGDYAVQVGDHVLFDSFVGDQKAANAFSDANGPTIDLRQLGVDYAEYKRRIAAPAGSSAAAGPYDITLQGVATPA